MSAISVLNYAGEPVEVAAFECGVPGLAIHAALTSTGFCLTHVASGLLVGWAGAFYAAYFRTASTDVFGMALATLCLSMVLVGGASTLYGPLLAAFVLSLLSEATAELGALRPIATGVLIIAVMLLYPSGLYGACQQWAKALAQRTP